MNSGERYFVAVSPSGKPDAALLSRTAALLDTDEYGARRLLSGELPRVVAQFPGRQPAEKFAAELRSLGLATLSKPLVELEHTPPPVFIARSMQADKQGVVFVSSAAETIVISTADASLILEGAMSVAGTAKKEPRMERKLNMPATLLLGGIPVWSKSRSEAEPFVEQERFLRIYTSRSPDPLVEIRSTGFDYSSLGEKKGLSSTENFNTLAGELRALFPKAGYDARLSRAEVLDAGSITPQEALEQICRLIYLFATQATKT